MTDCTFKRHSHIAERYVHTCERCRDKLCNSFHKYFVSINKEDNVVCFFCNDKKKTIVVDNEHYSLIEFLYHGMIALP